MIGPHARARPSSRACASVIRAHPERWIAQDVVRLSTVPTVGPEGRLHPRHVDLRPFAVFGERIDIVPGGLTRVALEEGSMIVNSSRGGGSKDTWVLEDGDDADRAGAGGLPIADTLPPALPDLRYGPWSGQQQQQQQQRGRGLMLARIAHELYWLGRNLARAEFTARAVEAVFQAELQGASEAMPSVSFGSGGLLAMLGDAEDGAPGGAASRSTSLTLDAAAARLDAGERRARPRGRAHGARRDQRRDVGGDQHHRARAARRRAARLGTAPPGRPVPGLAVRQAAHGADLGRRRPLDAARRSQVLPGRGRPDRGLRHGAADAAHRAAAGRGQRSGRRARPDPAAGRRRLSRIPAGRHRAAQRAPGGALPAVRARLPGQRGGVRGLAARGVHARPTPARATPSRCCA